MIDDFSVLQPVFSYGYCNFAFIIIWQLFFVHDFSPGTFALLLSRRLSLVYNRKYFSEKDVTI